LRATLAKNIVFTMSTTHPVADHVTVHTLAARAQIDPRTARRVLLEGLGSIRTRTIRERVAAALADLPQLEAR
jgi:hypothetical protein